MLPPAEQSLQDLRTKLAQRLHDTLCQYATALNTELFMLAQENNDELNPPMRRIRDLAEQITLELRRILKELQHPNRDLNSH
jgi:signal transduction histidine kinase